MIRYSFFLLFIITITACGGSSTEPDTAPLNDGQLSVIVDANDIEIADPPLEQPITSNTNDVAAATPLIDAVNFEDLESVETTFRMLEDTFPDIPELEQYNEIEFIGTDYGYLTQVFTNLGQFETHTIQRGDEKFLSYIDITDTISEFGGFSTGSTLYFDDSTTLPKMVYLKDSGNYFTTEVSENALTITWSTPSKQNQHTYVFSIDQENNKVVVIAENTGETADLSEYISPELFTELISNSPITNTERRTKYLNSKSHALERNTSCFQNTRKIIDLGIIGTGGIGVAVAIMVATPPNLILAAVSALVLFAGAADLKKTAADDGTCGVTLFDTTVNSRCKIVEEDLAPPPDYLRMVPVGANCSFTPERLAASACSGAAPLAWGVNLPEWTESYRTEDGHLNWTGYCLLADPTPLQPYYDPGSKNCSCGDESHVFSYTP